VNPRFNHHAIFGAQRNTVTSLRRSAALAAIALSTLVVACGPSGPGGNGEDGKNADQIVKDAQAALKSVSAYHLKGNISNDKGNVALDVKIQDKNTLSGHLQQGGVDFDFVTVDSKIYFRGKELWQKFNADVADQVGDKWVTVSGNTDMESQLGAVEELSDASSLADSLGAEGGPFSKNGTTSYNGQNVVVVKGKDGTLDVALSGKPYPVHLDAGSHGKMDITDFGGKFGIKAPAGALDLSDLTGDSSSSSGDTTKAVVDAVKVRDGIIQVAQSLIPKNPNEMSQGWGVADAVVKQLPTDIDVILTDTVTSPTAATPQKVVLGALHEDTADIFVVVTLDTNGTCAVGALTGTPPTHGPYKATLPSGKDCTVGNAISALAG
jgi:hypothetical protein